MKMAGATDRGLKRTMNQDSLFFDEAAGIAIVADGIGGRKGGEIASSMVVNHLRKAFETAQKLSPDDLYSFLQYNIQAINSEIFNRSQLDAHDGMGTTLECLVFAGQKLLIGHVGDSRTYMISRGDIFQLTTDHNVGSFIDQGLILPQSIHPQTKREALVKAVGIAADCEPDIYEIEVRPEYVFLTCSDGLFNMLTTKEIVGFFTGIPFDQIPEKLIAAANAKGGKDNITVSISQFEKSPGVTTQHSPGGRR